MAVAGCKTGAQQYEHYQINHKGQTNFCEGTLLPACVILLPWTILLCLSPTINSVEYAGAGFNLQLQQRRGSRLLACITSRTRGAFIFTQFSPSFCECFPPSGNYTVRAIQHPDFRKRCTINLGAVTSQCATTATPTPLLIPSLIQNTPYHENTEVGQCLQNTFH